MPNVKKPKLTETEVKRLLDAAVENRQDWLILKLLVITGARINEL